MRSRLVPFAMVLLMALLSCRAIREHRVNKAVGTVLSDDKAREKVYQIQSGLHPIIPQVPVYIKGDTIIDSIPYPVDRVRDSIIQAMCPPLNLDSLKKLLVTKIYFHTVDTVELPADTSTYRQLDNARFLNSYKDGQMLAMQQRINKLESTNGKWTWYFIGSIIVILFLGGFLARKIFN